MLNGEWWLDEGGQATFADGDVGDANHEMIAFYASLRLDSESPVVELTEEACKEHGIDAEDEFGDGTNPVEFPIELTIEVGHLSKIEAAALLDSGAPEEAVEFYRKSRQADAREYALEFMGWIRVKNANIETFKFDDVALENIKGAEFWDEEDEESEDQVFIEELSTRKSWSIPMKTLLKAQSAEGLKRYMEGVGQFRDFKGGGAMDVFIFQADIWCADCGRLIQKRLEEDNVEDTGDSDDYPQGPFGDGGGEADSPQFCAAHDGCINFIQVDGRKIGAPLENPLTTDGVEYLKGMIKGKRSQSQFIRVLKDVWGDYL